MAGQGATREPKRMPNMANAWQEARGLIWRNRRQLALGLLLMLVNRLSGLVLPASTKTLID
jgi:subfamily B ATP-binding cassette protein MsbA